MNNHLTEQEKKHMVELRKQGLTTKVIAQRMGVSTCTVHTYAPMQKQNRTYLIESPTGEIHSVSNIVSFCKEQNLNAGSMHRLINGTYNHHKGWKILSVTEPQTAAKDEL